MVNKYTRDQKYSYNKIPAKQEEEKSTTDYELTMLSYVEVYPTKTYRLIDFNQFSLGSDRTSMLI